MPPSPGDPGLGRIPVDPQVAIRLRSSLDQLRSRGENLVLTFYARLFELFPEIRKMFGPSSKIREIGSLEALTLVVGHIGEPERLRPTLEALGKRLAAAGVRPEQYPVACRLMLDVMRDGSGESWTASLEAEWSQALMLVSEVMLEGTGESRRTVPGPRTRAKQTTRRAQPSAVPTRRD